jgi:hypothetical protein
MSRVSELLQTTALVREVDDLEAEIEACRIEAAAINVGERQNLERAVSLGHRLERLKARCGHGKWGKILERMRLSRQRSWEFRQFSKCPPVDISECDSIADARRLLRGDSSAEDTEPGADQPGQTEPEIVTGVENRPDNAEAPPPAVVPPDEDSYGNPGEPPTPPRDYSPPPSVNGHAEPPKTNPLMCEQCATKTRKGQELPPDCKECKAKRKAAGVDGHGRKTGTRTAPPPKEAIIDKTGAAVPDSCRDAFADTKFAELVETMHGVREMLTADKWVENLGKLTAHYPFILLDKFQQRAGESLDALNLAIEHAEAGLPHAVCPKCKGEPGSNGKACKSCRGCGHVPQCRYVELTA